MTYTLLLLSVVFSSLGSTTLPGIYSRKNAGKRGQSELYALCRHTGLLAFWAVYYFAFDFSFEPRLLPICLIMGIGYISCFFVVDAMACGPVSLTSLFLSLSLVAPSIWGFFFWDTKVTVLSGAGICLVLVSLWLALHKGKEKNPINKKWLMYVLIFFVGNSAYTIAQRDQQAKWNGEHRGQIMFLGLALAFLGAVVWYMMRRKKGVDQIPKKTMLVPFAASIINGVFNLFMMILATLPISPSIVYPAVAVGSLGVTSLISVIFLKERLRWWQWCGIAIGALAVGLLSI